MESNYNGYGLSARIPLLPSSSALRFHNIDDGLSSNSNTDRGKEYGYGYEPLESIEVSSSYADDRQSMASETGGYEQNRSRENRPPGARYRTLSYDGFGAGSGGEKRRNDSSNTSKRPTYIHHTSNQPVPPPFLSKSRQAIRGFSDPHVSTHKHPLPLPTPAPKVRLTNRSQNARTSIIYLSLYFALNLLLTLYNKSLLNRFPFPYTLTALHALSATVGGRVLAASGFLGGGDKLRMGSRERLVVAAFSALYASNIAISNVSLHMVTVPVSLVSPPFTFPTRLGIIRLADTRPQFHQVIRASTPVFTIALTTLLFGIRGGGGSKAKIVSLGPVILGVGFA